MAGDCAVTDNGIQAQNPAYKRQHAPRLAFVKIISSILRVKNEDKVGVSANYQNIFTLFFFHYFLSNCEKNNF